MSPVTSRPLHRSALPLLLVAAGGAGGAWARYLVGEAWTHHGSYPWPVLIINCLGAFVLGCLLESLTRRGADEGNRRSIRLLVGTGFCGAFTTYSTFAHDVVSLGHHHPGVALCWGVGEVVLGFLSAVAGAWLAARTTRSAERALA